MTRRLVAGITLVVSFVVVVAFVRAQDDETQSVLRSLNSTDQEPILSSPPPLANRNSDGQQSKTASPYSIDDASGSSVTNGTPSRSSAFADRLRRVRESASNGEQSESTIPTTRGGSGFNTTPRSAAAQLTDNGPLVKPVPVAPSSTSGTKPARRRIARSPIPGAEAADEVGSNNVFQPHAPLTIQPEAFGETGSAAAIIDSPPASIQRPAPTAGELFSSQGPSLRVDTVGPSAVVIGKTAEYTILLTNLGNIAADEVYVRIELPTWVEIENATATTGATQSQEDITSEQKLVWTIDRIGPRAKHQLSIKVRPTANRPFDLMVDWATRSISNVAQIEVQQPRLEMALYGPKNVQFGETSVYTIQLTNPGTGQADNVAVEFSYGARRLEKKILGTIGPGEQTEVNVELTAQQAGQIRVSVAATGDTGLRAEASEDVLVRRGELNVDVMGSSLKFAGGVGTYKVKIKNVGDATVNDVVASILLPRGAKLMTGERDNESARVVEKIGSLIPGAERIVSLQCQLMMPGENRIEVAATASDGLQSSSDFVTRVEALADLKLTVNDPRGPTPLGEDAVYEIHIANLGTKMAEKVSVVAQFSEGVEPIESTGSGADIVTGQVLFHPIPRIAPGDEIVLKIVARAGRAGNHRFRAELTCSEPDTRLIAEESTYYFGEDVPLSARSTSEDSPR